MGTAADNTFLISVVFGVQFNNKRKKMLLIINLSSFGVESLNHLDLIDYFSFATVVPDLRIIYLI